MANEPTRKDAGIVTAYGAAVRGGYTGTYEEFCRQQANYAEYAQDVEEAKEAAQEAARQAVEAIESYDEMTAEATGLPAGSNPTAEMDHTGEHPVLRLGIAPGADGYSPTVTVTSITGGHRVTITDEQGDHSFDVMDGEDGQPGDDGYSPTVAVTTITGGHRITITDAQGDHSFDVMDGQDGDDGYSPTVTVTDITGGHRVTITDAQGDHTFDVMNGLDGTGAVDSVNGKTGPVVLDGRDINVNNSASTPKTVQEELGDLNRALNDKYEKPSGGIPASDLANGVIPTIPVQDVQVNGTSILDNGVANVPIGTSDILGVHKINVAYGTAVRSDGTLYTATATDAQIKGGTHGYVHIKPSNQHTSVFYGLAKLAGADMASSSNAVGTYTDAAKKAIRKMLGIQNNTWELISDYTLSEDSDTVIIDTDVNGQPFLLDKLDARIFLTANATGQNNYFYVNPQGINGSGTTTYLAAPTGAWPTNGAAGFCELYSEKIDDFVRSEMRKGATVVTNAQAVHSSSSNVLSGLIGMNAIRFKQYDASSSLFTAGTRIMLYGIRSDE